MSRKPVQAQLGERSRAEVNFDKPQLLPRLFGEFDSNLLALEERLGVYIHARGQRVQIEGSAEAVAHAREVLQELHSRVIRGEDIDTGLIEAVIAMIAVAATFCGIVVLSTSAYFTAQTVLPSNGVNPGTVALNTAPSFTLSNVVPLSSTTAQTVTTGSIVNFDVAAGSLETRGTVSVTDLGSSMGNAVLPWLRVAIFDGTTWTTPVAGNTVPATAEFTIAGGATRAMKLRFYLDSAVPDSLQGKAISFTITTRGIQSGAPVGTSY